LWRSGTYTGDEVAGREKQVEVKGKKTRGVLEMEHSEEKPRMEPRAYLGGASLGAPPHGMRAPFVGLLAVRGSDNITEVHVLEITQAYAVVRYKQELSKLVYTEIIPWHEIQFIRTKHKEG
jgi:hypothetical protein